MSPVSVQHKFSATVVKEILVAQKAAAEKVAKKYLKT